MRKSHTTIILIFLFLIASVCVFLLAGNDTDTQEVDLYFFSSDSSILMPVETEITSMYGDELYARVAEALIKGPSGKKYKPIMSKDITVNYITNDNGNLKIDFSSKYREENILTSYAVIKSFCRLSDVFRVSISAGGQNITDYISGDEINLEFDDDSAQSITLYFADSSKSKLVREYRKISITDTQPIEQYIVNELIKGSKHNTALLAPDTGVLSVETTDGTCYINFKQDFINKNTASFEQQQLVVFSIVNSLTERDGIDNVQLLIDGKKTDKFGEMNISDLFYRRDDLIKN